jgi:thiamine kinase-like enzyme
MEKTPPTGIVPPQGIPFEPEAYDAGLLNAIIAPWRPDVRVETVRVKDAKRYGDGMVSTAARAFLDVDYVAGSPAGLPRHLVLKLGRSPDFMIGPLYQNEVRFYNALRTEMTDIEAPFALGGSYDPTTQAFALLLGDLTDDGARFPNVLTKVTLDEVRAILETLARLHARYWQSPRFGQELAFLETHTQGDLATFMHDFVPMAIQQEIDTENFKRELVARLRTSGDELRRGVARLHQHQQTLPHTLLHGDTHIGNIYLLADGRAGLLDWQLTVRGHHMHDVNYIITTALPIDLRRDNERELLAFYLDRLKAHGVADTPAFSESWDEYRRCLVWGVYIGWLTTNIANYGWEISVLNHLRLTTAFEDHDTAALIRALG